MKELIQRAINDQIRAEFQSAYTYLGMSAIMEAHNLKGFANWLRVQWEEEVVHAMKFYEFVLQRGGKVELHALQAPGSFSTMPMEMFERVLELEKDTTSRIHNLYDLAVQERDYALQTLLHWYIDEQVEEEDIVNEILEKLRLIGSSGSSLFLLDQELGQRTGEEEDA